MRGNRNTTVRMASVKGRAFGPQARASRVLSETRRLRPPRARRDGEFTLLLDPERAFPPGTGNQFAESSRCSRRSWPVPMLASTETTVGSISTIMLTQNPALRATEKQVSTPSSNSLHDNESPFDPTISRFGKVFPLWKALTHQKIVWLSTTNITKENTCWRRLNSLLEKRGREQFELREPIVHSRRPVGGARGKRYRLLGELHGRSKPRCSRKAPQDVGSIPFD